MAIERVPGNGTYAGIALWLAFVSSLAFFVSAAAAVRWLAVSFVILGLLRVFSPAGIVPTVRSRVFDVTVCFLFAGVLTYLSQWATIPTVM